MNEYLMTQRDITAFARYLHTEERSAGTIEKYLRDVRAFACWMEGRAVVKEDAALWKAHLLGLGYAPVTINSIASCGFIQCAQIGQLLEFSNGSWYNFYKICSQGGLAAAAKC